MKLIFGGEVITKFLFLKIKSNKSSLMIETYDEDLYHFDTIEFTDELTTTYNGNKPFHRIYKVCRNDRSYYRFKERFYILIFMGNTYNIISNDIGHYYVKNYGKIK